MKRDPGSPSPAEVFAAYHETFDEPLPTFTWTGTDEALAALALEAIERGAPLNETDIARAQGRDPPPPDVLLSPSGEAGR
jgi:hypothetical protein